MGGQQNHQLPPAERQERFVEREAWVITKTRQNGSKAPEATAPSTVASNAQSGGCTQKLRPGQVES